MDIIIIILLIIGIASISISWFKNDLHCPPPEIIYRYVPANVIDTQFSAENLPSNVYGDMFNNNNILVGGKTISIGDYTSPPKQSVPFMSMKNTPIPLNLNSGPNTGPTNNF